MSRTTSKDLSTAPLGRFSPSPTRDPDAGLRALHHYERRLPRWRHEFRKWLIPVVRWETPYLARMQSACRSPVLDSYFAVTANLGTHTFFMLFLPICFWCGYPDFGIALIHMLGLGVYLSGALKDLVCLPRPLSPPLQRITMSGTAALEYGFPSTHTTNAVSVALFALHQLHQSEADRSATSYKVLCGAFYCYATSITLGRVYCGMHGFFDVLIGGILGAFVAWLRITYGPLYDSWILSDGWLRPAIVVLILAVAIRFHPEPADDCPCFDDSVAFLGVIMGAAIAIWHYGQTNDSRLGPGAGLSPQYPYTNQDLLKSAGRLLGGIVMIFAWRAMMKPLLLRYLPPTFRFVDHWGLMFPRRYFLQARDYTNVPPMRKDDNVLPSASEIPSLLSSFRNPRRRRISVGPQSEADAREYLATREQTRREGKTAGSPKRKSQPAQSDAKAPPIPSPVSEEPAEQAAGLPSPINAERVFTSSLQVNTAASSLLTPPLSETGTSSDSSREDEKNDREMFSALEKPRTHYDVEVITKLVVYAGESNHVRRVKFLPLISDRHIMAYNGGQPNFVRATGYRLMLGRIYRHMSMCRTFPLDQRLLLDLQTLRPHVPRRLTSTRPAMYPNLTETNPRSHPLASNTPFTPPPRQPSAAPSDPPSHPSDQTRPAPTKPT